MNFLKINNIKIWIAAVLALSVTYACSPDDGPSLGSTLPSSPDFTIKPVNDNSNRFVVEDISTGNFSRVWDFGPGGSPKAGTQKIDTVKYAKKGTYCITLNVASGAGLGNSFKTQCVTVEQDAQTACDETLAVLLNDCTLGCWGFVTGPGAIQVGPTPLSSEWFKSNALVPTQYDDVWCISGTDFSLDYRNAGSSFSTCAGYVEVPNYPIAKPVSVDYKPTAGISGAPRLILSNDKAWIGVEDSGPVYDIVQLTPTTMTLVSPIKPCDGSASPGFFTLFFQKK